MRIQNQSIPNDTSNNGKHWILILRQRSLIIDGKRQLDKYPEHTEHNKTGVVHGCTANDNDINDKADTVDNH
jgi:hypothetical protein